MYKSLKKFLITGVSLLTLAGVSAGMNHAAHASMPDPEYYHSTNQRHNVYYGIGKSKWGEKVNYLLYGKMPKPMRKRGHIFPLYHGRAFNKEVGGQHTSLDRTLYRNGQVYWPDYVGYTLEARHDDGSDAQNRINYHGHKGYIEDIFINRKDIGRPLKNQNNQWAMNHDYLNSVHYIPVGHYSHRKASKARRKAYRKPRLKRGRHKVSYKRNRKARKATKKNYKKAMKKVRIKKHRTVNSDPATNTTKPTDHVDMTEMANREFNDINQDREANGVTPLNSSSQLSQLAAERAKQAESDFGHYDNAHGAYYADEDAHQMGYAHDQNGVDDWANAENLNEAYPGGTADQIADEMNHSFMYDDASSNWGHRDNILNPAYHYVGVGTYYDPNASVPYKLAEDFSNTVYY